MHLVVLLLSLLYNFKTYECFLSPAPTWSHLIFFSRESTLGKATAEAWKNHVLPTCNWKIWQAVQSRNCFFWETGRSQLKPFNWETIISSNYARATVAITGPYHTVRKIHNGVSQLQNQCQLTIAMLMNFWIVLMKAKTWTIRK